MCCTCAVHVSYMCMYMCCNRLVMFKRVTSVLQACYTHVTNMCHMRVAGTSKMYMCCNRLVMFKRTTCVLQACYTHATHMLQTCVTCVSQARSSCCAAATRLPCLAAAVMCRYRLVVLHACYKRVTHMLHACYMRVTGTSRLLRCPETTAIFGNCYRCSSYSEVITSYIETQASDPL